MDESHPRRRTRPFAITPEDSRRDLAGQEAAFDLQCRRNDVEALLAEMQLTEPGRVPSEVQAKNREIDRLKEELAAIDRELDNLCSGIPAESNVDKKVDHAVTSAGKRPTYTEAPVYSKDKIPDEFLDWANNQLGIITADMAEDAMRGRKDNKGQRAGGILRQGPGLGRNTIRLWVATLPDEKRAQRGETPSRRKKRHLQE